MNRLKFISYTLVGFIVFISFVSADPISVKINGPIPPNMGVGINILFANGQGNVYQDGLPVNQMIPLGDHPTLTGNDMVTIEGQISGTYPSAPCQTSGISSSPKGVWFEGTFADGKLTCKTHKL